LDKRQGLFKGRRHGEPGGGSTGTGRWLMMIRKRSLSRKDCGFLFSESSLGEYRGEAAGCGGVVLSQQWGKQVGW